MNNYQLPELGNKYNGKPMLIMLVGIPGSGKTTIAKQMAAEYNCRVFSSDDYRKYYCANAHCHEANEITFKLLHQDLIKSLKQGENCIYDATNLKRKNRMAFFDLLRRNSVDCFRIAWAIPTPISVCIENNKNREAVVPEGVIMSMVAAFEFPQYFEGFSDIYILGKENTIPLDKEGADEMQDFMMGYDQKSKWHYEGLGEHCAHVCKIAQEKGANGMVLLAAMWHDVGKLFTQSFDEEGEAHYYNHGNFGAYYLMLHPEYLSFVDISMENLYEVIFLVNYHMRPFQWNTIKAKNKWKRVFGEYWYNDLMLLYECDKASTEREEK